jgi:F-type H+-transporting ATPase subunit delta
VAANLGEIGKVGEVYAEALFELAKESNDIDGIYKTLNDYADIFSDNPDLMKLLAVPTIPVPKKIEIVNKVFPEENLVSNFICILVEKSRITGIENVRSEFNKKYNELNNIAEMTVYTVKPLDDDTRRKLTEKLADKYQKTIKLREKIDPELIGGIVVKYGNKVMDNSIRTKLKNIGKSMKTAN